MKGNRKTKLYEWQQKGSLGGVCEKCKLERKVLTVDHIIPVEILNTLDITGEAVYEDEQNFQLVCFPCNQFKRNRIDITNPKTKILLQKYINLL